ncbi:MAG: transglycosylase SLT domain-containing protein [Bryobacteraceae bacterium]
MSRTQPRSLARGFRIAFLLVFLCSVGHAQTLETLARDYRDKPTAVHRAALLRFAAAHAKDSSGALALLAAGVIANENKQSADASATLKGLAGRLPSLADFANYAQASAEAANNQPANAAKTAAQVWAFAPKSPLAQRAILLAAKALAEAGSASQALALLQQQYANLPQPQADMALGAAFEGANDPARAVVYYQRVYYGFPGSKDADDAESAAQRLRASLGDKYPAALPQSMLARAFRLLDGKQATRARSELETLVPMLSGPEKDLAEVRVGVASYVARDNAAAFRYLKSLDVAAPEADAERLYYLLATARRLKNIGEVHATLDLLGRKYPQSRWRLEALTTSANHYVLENQPSEYEPLFRACYQSFGADLQASACHWKATWTAYLRRRPEAADMLRDHLRKYPQSEHGAASLYYLGRLAEASRDNAAARSYYQEVTRLFPNYYYMTVARERLKVVGRAEASPKTADFLRSLTLRGGGGPQLAFEPTPAAKFRIDRARLLASAALDDWAEIELRYGAQTENQPAVFAMELGELSTRRGSPDKAVRWIKRYVPGYLTMPVDSAPTRFWQLAFPLPFREDLERNAKERSIDPYMLAALIRQESEFNPKALSRAKAYGLTQIMPPTGRELSRRLKIRPYSTTSLFLPSVNLKMGAYYFRTLLDSLEGKVEATLASYNAGRSRAIAWMNWGEFREPSEYIETIPFSETRDYVQSVLRNADVYRRVYGDRKPVVDVGDAKAVPAAAKPRPKRP